MVLSQNGKWEEEILLKVVDLKKYFRTKKQLFSKKIEINKAVDGVSFTIKRGEALGVVGESGCGKTTTGRVILRLLDPTSGEAFFEGQNLLRLSKKELYHLRPNMQIIFQNPYESLNPRMRIGEIIGEGLSIHHLLEGEAKRKRVMDLLDMVGLQREHENRYPHEFSGGQRQRICIARALATTPKLIIADEPVSSLDVSIQAQILNLMMDLRDNLNLTYLFISHDLNVVKKICDRVAVMYRGRIVEMARSKAIFQNTFHPYTKLLLASIPVPDPDAKRKKISKDYRNQAPESPRHCAFYPRCIDALELCSQEEPVLKELETDHYVACHLI